MIKKVNLMIEKVDLYRKSRFISKKSIEFVLFEFFFDIIIIQIQIKSSRQVYQAADIGSKKLIKIQFESHLKQNFA